MGMVLTAGKFSIIQYSLGYMYAHGEGVKRDLGKAFDWYMEAAEQGHVEAQYEVGEMYSNGLGDEEAFDWFMKAAEQDHAEAQYKVGEAYYCGKGVDEDLEEAFVWYLKSAEQEYADAQ